MKISDKPVPVDSVKEARRVGAIFGVRLSDPREGNCNSSLGRTWSGYKDPYPTLIDPRLNIKSAMPKITETVKFAKGEVENSRTSALSVELTRRIRDAAKHLPECYPTSRLTQRPLMTYKYMVSHPTFCRNGGPDVVLFSDKSEVEHKIRVTEELRTLDASDDMYDALCLYNADFSRTFPVANVIHQQDGYDVDLRFPLECVRAYGRHLQNFILSKLSSCNIEGPLAKINPEKGLGFYAFHPDGTPLSDVDRYVVAVDKLLPRLPNGKPYNDGLLAYHVKNTRLLRLEWQRSERIDKIWDDFISHDYCSEPEAFVNAFITGGAMVQTDGERRNQCDTFLNKSDIDSDVRTWRARAYGKDRRISLESEPLVFTTFRRDDAKYETFARDLTGRDSKGCRARPVKGQPSTTLGPVLNSYNKLIWHHVEGSAVGFPSFRDSFIEGMHKLAVKCESEDYSVYWLRSDDENSEQLSTLCGERLMEMYQGNLRQVMCNESLSIHPSIFGPLVVPFSLMSGDPFTTWKNVTKGMLTSIRSLALLFGLEFNAQFVDQTSREMFGIFMAEDPARCITIRTPKYGDIRWYPRLGTDDQLQPVAISKQYAVRAEDFKEAIGRSSTLGTSLSFGATASGFGCVFDGPAVSVNRPAQIGKIEYYELNKRHRSSALQAFVFYQRLKLLTPAQVSVLERSYKKQWGSDFSELPRVESWFYNEVVAARGYAIPALFNEYSPVDQVAFADLIRRFEGDGDSYYHKDDIGRNLTKLINFTLRS